MIVLKIQQIEYAIEVSKTLSFSKASKNLYVSQPNISSAISSLEKELGFSIFLRTNQGISITEKGMEFFQHAQNILYELKQIEAIKSNEKYYNFSVKSAFNHSATSEAFIKLCLRYQNSNKMEFSLTDGNLSEIMDDVYLNKSQLGIVMISENLLAHTKGLVKNKELELIVIKKVGININLSYNHPLLKNDPFIFNELNKYTYVDYDFNIGSDYPDIISKGIVNLSRVIRVNERETRIKIVSTTDAFSIGCTLPPEIQKSSRCVSIPLDGVYCYVAYIKKQNLPLLQEAEDFIDILKTELDFIE